MTEGTLTTIIVDLGTIAVTAIRSVPTPNSVQAFSLGRYVASAQCLWPAGRYENKLAPWSPSVVGEQSTWAICSSCRSAALEPITAIIIITFILALHLPRCVAGMPVRMRGKRKCRVEVASWVQHAGDGRLHIFVARGQGSFISIIMMEAARKA